MTYHMEKTMSLMRSVEWKPSKTEDKILSVNFPWKLWQAVNSQDFVLIWNDAGTGISVNPSYFEVSVMQSHPGLVEIPTFANFRRQMREYGFKWTHCKFTGDFTFSHPCFVRERQDLIHLVVTRRKSKYVRGVLGLSDLPKKNPLKRRTSRRGRSYNNSSVRDESFWFGSSISNRSSASRIIPEPSSTGTGQQSYFNVHVFQRPTIGNVRLRHLAAEPHPGPAMVEKWISLVPSPSCTSGFGGVPVSTASSGSGNGLTQTWYGMVGTDEDEDRDKQEENSWWNECFPWVLQQDADLSRQFEIDNLSATVVQRSQKVGIPLHFYSDSFQTIPETTAGTYPCFVDSPAGTSGRFFGLSADNGRAVIEIKPITDDEGFPDV